MNRLFIVSDCGGVGRTTVAANLAHALAARGERVRLRDDDPQRALAVHFRSVEPVGADRAQASMIAPPHRPLAPNVDLALESAPDLDARPLGGIRSAAPAHDIEIVDTPSASREARAAADGDYVLCVMTPEARCFRTLPPLLARHADASERGLSRHFVGMINAFEPESALARDTVKLIEDAFGGRLLPSVVLRDASLPEAFAGGLPIAEYAPWSQAADAFGKIADTFIAMRAARHAAA